MNNQRNVLYQTAIVTGAARGIGKEIALRFAESGMKVGICDILEDVFTTQKEIQEMGGVCHAELLDIANETEIEKGLENFSRELGAIDVLINNAGIGRLKKATELTVDEWDRTFAINVRAPFIFSKLLLPQMVENQSGLIVNIASIWGLRGARGRAVYASTKHALVGLSKCLADEYKSAGIRVIALCPGNVKTDLANEYVEGSEGWMKPGDVADVVAFLTEKRGNSFVGTVVEVDGWGSPPEFNM